MSGQIDRRGFMRAAAATAAIGLGGTIQSQASGTSREAKKGFKKAVIVSHPDETILKKVKEAGFDGVEVNAWGEKDERVTPEQAADVKKIADGLGLRIHTVLRGWAQFNSTDPAKVEADFDFTAATLRAAQGYGADAVLVVPGRIGGEGMKMPGKRDYSVKFDPTTGHVTQLVEGNNAEYQECLYAHNHAWDAFQKVVPKLIPIAEETGVIVALENVWNNLILTPEHFAAFIDSFHSPWIKAYFDVANHLVYGPPPEKWIRTMGDRIAKIHIKDYKIDPPEGGTEWPDLREGDVNFPAVVAALKEIGYGDGWLTLEGSGGLSIEEQSKRMDLVIAGE
jgi:hexulose-6-phosphate isomerase